jgi:hypothetical protein
MADVEKVVLVKADVISNFIKTKKELDGVKIGYDNLSEIAARVASEQGKNTVGYQRVNKQLTEQAEKLANANNAYKDAKKAIEASARSQELLNSVSDKTVKSLGEMQRELTALRNVPLSLIDEKESMRVKKAMAELTQKIQTAKNEIKGLDNSKMFANLASSMQALSAGATTIIGTLSLFGVENEKIKKLNQSMIQLIGITQALGVVTEYLSKKKYQLLIANVKNISALIAEKAAMIAHGIATLGTAAATLILGKSANTASIAFKGLRAALISTGIGALIVGVGLLITGLGKLFSLFKSKPDKDLVASYEKISQAYDKATKDNEKHIKSLQDKGRTESEVLNESIKLYEAAFREAARLQVKVQELDDDDLYQNAIKRTQEARKLLEETAGSIISVLDKVVGSVEAANLKKSMSDDEYTNYLIKNNTKQLKAHVAFLSSFGLLTQAQVDMYYSAIEQYEQNQLGDIAKKATETAKKTTETAKQEYKKQQKNLSDAAVKEIEIKTQSAEAAIENDKGFNSKGFSQQQAHELKLFNLDQQAAKDKLDIQKKYGQITQTEYDRQNNLLAKQQIKFNNQQTQQALDKIKSLQKETAKLIKQETNDEIADYKAAFEAAKDELIKQQELVNEAKKSFKPGKGGAEEDDILDQEKEIYAKRAALDAKFNEDTAEIRKRGLDKIAALTDKKYDDIYSSLFNKASNNELKTLELEKEMLQKRIAAKKAEGITDTSDDEAALLSNKIQLIQANAALELSINAKTSKQRYEIQRKALEAEAQLYDKNSIEYANIQAAIRDLDKAQFEEKIELLNKYAEFAAEAMSSISEIMSNLSEARIAKAEEQNTQEKDSLKAMLDANLINQIEYDRKVKESDAKLAKEKAKAARKQAIMDKLMSIFEIGVSTAKSIMASADKGFPTAIPFVAMSAALGALQMAAVASKPVPQAAKGRVIGGKPHSQGGTIIEAERGEAIVNKRSMGLFPELLSLINQMGGGVPFTSSLSDGGFAMRQYKRENATQSISADDIAAAVSTAMQDVNIYTSIEDIRKGNARYTNVTGISEAIQ